MPYQSAEPARSASQPTAAISEAGHRLPPPPPRPAAARVRDGQCLNASLIFAPACLVLPLTWSPRPSACRRSLPVARPVVFLAPPLTASALCAIFLAILMVDCLS